MYDGFIFYTAQLSAETGHALHCRAWHNTVQAVHNAANSQRLDYITSAEETCLDRVGIATLCGMYSVK
jgi:hypothetical protein